MSIASVCPICIETEKQSPTTEVIPSRWKWSETPKLTRGLRRALPNAESLQAYNFRFRRRPPKLLGKMGEFYYAACRDGDSAAETAAKLTLVAIYNERLTERARRRDFLRTSGFLDARRQQVCTAPNHMKWTII